MTHLLHYYFAEPGAPWWKAAIWGNIFASILWGFAAGFVGYFAAKALRRAERRLHAKLDSVHEKLDGHAASLKALHAKVDAQAKARPTRAVKKPPGRP
jgi:hypothetical protein